MCSWECEAISSLAYGMMCRNEIPRKSPAEKVLNILIIFGLVPIDA